MKSRYEFDRDRLQRYLPMLRACADFSAEDLAQKVGTSKQMISILETHLDKQMSKMQYIAIRHAFEEEYYKNRENINLRDCYDLVFSEPSFYIENRNRIDFAIQKAVEDTKLYKQKIRAEIKKEKRKIRNMESAGTAGVIAGSAMGAMMSTSVTTGALSLAGATSTTLAVGGIAAATFPMIFPLVGIAAATAGTIIHSQGRPKDGKKSKHGKNSVTQRASNTIVHSDWIAEALRSGQDCESDMVDGDDDSSH